MKFIEPQPPFFRPQMSIYNITLKFNDILMMGKFSKLG